MIITFLNNKLIIIIIIIIMGHNQQHLLYALSPCALSLSAISVKKAHAALVVAPGDKMATRSPAFNHFTKPVEVEEGKEIFKAKCKHCSKEVSIKGKSSSNLITHLKGKFNDFWGYFFYWLNVIV